MVDTTLKSMNSLSLSVHDNKRACAQVFMCVCARARIVMRCVCVCERYLE